MHETTANGGADAQKAHAFRGKKKAYYDRLMELREQLLDELTVLSGYSLTSTKQAGEELADVGSDNFQREMELGLVTEEGRKIRLIDDAVARLRNNTYGMCADCAEKIEEGRLEAMPYARLCIRCKSKREAAERG